MSAAAGLLAQTVPPSQWDWSFASEILPAMLVGLRTLVLVTLGGYAISVVLGLVLAIGRRARLRVVRASVALVIEFVRSTPLLIQLFFVFYGLPEFGIRMSPITTGIVVLGIHFATYCSEAYRAGIEGVPAGQWEAAVTINLSTWQTWRQVVLPQAVPRVIPVLGNYLVAAFKDAVLVSTITAVELVRVTQNIVSSTFRPLEPWTLAGLLFLAVSIPAAIGVRYLEKRYARDT